MKIKAVQRGADLELGGLENYDISQIFDCGQTFRFDTDGEGIVRGIARGRSLTLVQTEPSTVLIRDMSAEEFEGGWRDYLAIDDSYGDIRSAILRSCGDDPTMTAAMKRGSGIRILHQPAWETLCSFIVSQNNNIPRIKGIIGRLSARFGEQIAEDAWSFPTAESLASAGTDAIFACGTGFRAKYITDAAEKVASGELCLDTVRALPTAEAAAELCRIKGVGPKVAACSLLFGFGKTDAFPIDVWVKRVLAKYYPADFDPACFGKYAGLAQQYLFYYERYEGGDEGKK